MRRSRLKVRPKVYNSGTRKGETYGNEGVEHARAKAVLPKSAERELEESLGDDKVLLVVFRYDNHLVLVSSDTLPGKGQVREYSRS